MCCVKFKIGLIIALYALIIMIKCDDSAAQPMSSSGSKKARCITKPNAANKVEKVIKECENDLKIQLIRDTFLILKEETINPHHEEDHVDHDDYDHNSHQLHHHHQHHHHYEEEAEDEHKNINLHIVHEPNSTYDHNPNYNHHDEYTKQYITQYDDHDDVPSSSSSQYQQDDDKNKYWVYPEQPSPVYGQEEPTKKYRSHRSKRSTHHKLDEDDEAWKYNYELNENIHSTTILAEDRWIAGCLIHCVLEKNNATDKHGWPTLDGLVAFYTDGVHEHDYFLQTLRFVDHCLKGASHRHGVHRYMVPERGQICDLSFDVFDCVTDKITEYCAHK